MALRYDTITFLSDYGLVDEFVGVVHSVIRSIAPEVHVVDLTHQIEPYDVRGGGLALARSAPYLCPGVVLAVVDPSVGTSRRPVGVEVGDGMSVLVGPDNGLLAPAVALCGGATRVVELTAEAYRLDDGATTFDGRDVFGPAAAHLARGVDLAELGPAVDPHTLMPGLVPLTREEDGALLAEVLWVDRFGNAQLNVDPDELAHLDDRVLVRVGHEQRTARPRRDLRRARRGRDRAGRRLLRAASPSPATGAPRRPSWRCRAGRRWRWPRWTTTPPAASPPPSSWVGGRPREPARCDPEP